MYRNTHLNILSALSSLAMFSAFSHPVVDLSFAGRGPKLRKTGTTYPHSSTRQRSRYARQIAAGKLKF